MTPKKLTNTAFFSVLAISAKDAVLSVPGCDRERFHSSDEDGVFGGSERRLWRATPSPAANASRAMAKVFTEIFGRIICRRKHA